MTDRYEQLFQRVADRSAAALIPYLVIGDPTPDDFPDLIDVLIENGADAVELGIAFSDPLADGPTIQEAAQRALHADITPDLALELVTEVRRRHPDLPIGLLVYANIVANIERFSEKCVAAGVDSVLVPDAPLEEDFPLGVKGAGLQRVYILPPNADDRLIGAIAQASEGYVYVTSRAGVTGASAAISADIGRHLPALAAHGAAPPVLGFGISTPQQVQSAVDAGYAGVIIGSALVACIARTRSNPTQMRAAAAEMIRDMKQATVAHRPPLTAEGN